MSYEIKQDFIPKGSKNRPGKIIVSSGTVLHSTATLGATDEREATFFDNLPADRNASPHACIDWDSITQLLPWNEKGYHAAEPANSIMQGIELCEPRDDDPDRFRKFSEVWNRAVWLFAYLQVNKLTGSIIMSHDEVSKKWHNTDHTDPVGYFKKYGKTVEQFKQAVLQEIDIQLGKATAPQEPAKKIVELIVTGISPCLDADFKVLKYFQTGDAITSVGVKGNCWIVTINGKDYFVPAGYTKYKN